MPISSHVRLIAGDVVTIRAVVRYGDYDDGSSVGLTAGQHDTMLFAPRDALELVSTKIAVGDEVSVERPEYTGAPDNVAIVLSIIEGRAWVRWIDTDGIVAVEDCRRLRTRQQILDDDKPAPALIAAE